MQRIISSSVNAPYLQEAIVTQRHGRYVVPLRAEFKGRIPGLVHDQSGSGATLFIEPLAVVEVNNQWREAQLAEEEEVRRVLARLTELVAGGSGAIELTLSALAELDFVFAKARYAQELGAVEPQLRPFAKGRAPSESGSRKEPDPQAEPAEADGDWADAIRHPGSTIRLLRARHPLLDPATVVPVDIYIDDTFFVLVVTGPNTGGKTVSLKTTGLLALMAQSGLHIPADSGSALTVFESIYADLGDEQSIEQSLSTFSSHMSQIVRILEQASERSLVLLDELGAGTDPEEGAALAQALLQTLLLRGVTTLATTHYSDLKLFAHNTPFVENASVEFDVDTLSPTYRLSIGVPGRSNAFAIARRLGLEADILEQAASMVSPENIESEALLADIRRAHDSALSAKADAQMAQRQIEALTQDLRYRLGQVEEARRAVINEARAQAQLALDELRDEIAQTCARLAGVSTGQTRHEEWLAEAEAVLARRAGAEKPLPPISAPPPLQVDGPLLPGDLVWVPSLQATGVISAVLDGAVEVKIGSFRIKLAPTRLELRERGGQPAVLSGFVAPRHVSPGMELDMRGLTVEDGLIELDRYLDAAYLAGLPYVRLIHGKGTGVLRQAVREALQRHPLVTSFETARASEGGDGATVASLEQQ